MEALPSFDALVGPLPVPLREPVLRAVYQRFLAENRFANCMPALQRAKDFRWRAYWAVRLGHLADPRTLPETLGPLKQDPHGFVRASCAWALGQKRCMAPESVAEALVERVREDPVWAVGRRAALSLGRLEGPEMLVDLWDRLDPPSLLPWVRRGLVEAMAPNAWTDPQIVAWLDRRGPEGWDALIFALDPLRGASLDLPPALKARLRLDPWTRDQLLARWNVV
jgi:hypothetical protein